MATLTARAAIDMGELFVEQPPRFFEDPAITENTASAFGVSFVNEFGDVEELTLFGSFPVRDEDGPVTGTITGLRYRYSGFTLLEVSGASMSVEQFALYAINDDLVGLFIDLFDGNDTFNGSGADDVLLGFAGNDLINGGAGADGMAGLIGNDTYVVDNRLDEIVEFGGEGTDTVRSVLTSYTLGDNLERLFYVGAQTRAFIGTGNGLRNTIEGGAANDHLDGRGGADTMTGKAGNDTYYVDSYTPGATPDDVIVEVAGQGTDTVRSIVSYVLPGNVENLILVGAANGTGNASANRIDGNGLANRIDGRAGADIMRGGNGNDTYVVDAYSPSTLIADDQVMETATGGTDTVEALVSYTLAASVENLVLKGVAAINGTGNGLANAMTGNGAANTLNGGVGNDTIKGGGGDDRLFGGFGNDLLQGDAGRDGFYFDTGLNRTSNVDTLAGFSAADDTILLDRDIFTQILVNGKLSSVAFRTGAAAADPDDRIVYNKGTGEIFYDPDGVGGLNQILFAKVAAGAALTNADFFAFI